MASFQPKPDSGYYTVADWLELHGLEVPVAREWLSSVSDPESAAQSRSSAQVLPSAEEIWSLASRALVEILPEILEDIVFIRDLCERDWDAPADAVPCTLDRVEHHTPLVSMCYQRTPEDALCVAHEFGHAVQYHLARGCFISPILREVAAFAAEKALIDFTHRERPDLYGSLRAAWEADSCVIFGRDVEKLHEALTDPTAPYAYRMNYPLARLLAEELLNASDFGDLGKIYRGGPSLPVLLSAMKDRRGAAIEGNYLPQVPDADASSAAMNSYQSLGMMALLDIDYLAGEPEKNIGEYYASRVAHMHEQTAFVAIGSEGKPIGYANWEVDKNDARLIRLKRLSAPFGNDLEVREKLLARLPENAKLVTCDTQEKQVTW
ncbi:hypothetical protein FHS72_003661 [Loktanella ponticola]|uniref:Uncharacterized protein n=1 Tax=Yoonia ponticola TaxID=1524255 RepID=A0A7W9EZL7_9RHOB|nr:hypothetical protein [Yoonia ponticola]MBB5724013.1 hypothetical protein [Yoonia ponticola]